MLFGEGVLMFFPSFMLLLSLTLKASVNRIVIIVVGFIHILVLIGTLFIGGGETWYYWRLYELLEVLFPALIIWTSWKWPSNESRA
jgi:predicted tellurium resistance membrane protein TerC